MAECDMIDDCRRRALKEAEFKGGAEARLINVESQNLQIWQAVTELRKSIVSLTWKVGIIAGGTSLVISIVAAVIHK